MSFNKEKFFKDIESGQYGWDSKMGKELSLVLMSEPMLAALTRVSGMLETDSISFRGLDFTTQGGISFAIKLQGRGEGILDVLQVLADCAEEMSDGES